MADLTRIRAELAAAREQLSLLRRAGDALDGQLAAVLALAVEGSSTPPSPPPPLPPAETQYIGGAPGVGGKRVERDKDFTLRLPADKPWISLSDYPDTDFHRCRLPRIRGNLRAGTRLLDCLMDGVHAPDMGDNYGSHLIYVNAGTGAQPVNFIVQGLRMVRCRATNGIEIKGTAVTIADCEQIECRNEAGTGPMTESVRLRNGGDHTVIRNKGFALISCRGWLKWVVDNPGARVQLWAGTTAARNVDPQATMNRPACDLAYVQGVGSVKVGQYLTGQTQYKATRCFVAPEPAQGSVEVTEHGTVTRRALRSIDELRALAA